MSWSFQHLEITCYVWCLSLSSVMMLLIYRCMDPFIQLGNLLVSSPLPNMISLPFFSSFFHGYSYKVLFGIMLHIADSLVKLRLNTLARVPSFLHQVLHHDSIFGKASLCFLLHFPVRTCEGKTFAFVH